MKIGIGKGNGIVDKNKSRRTVEENIKRRYVEYAAIGCEVAITFIIIFGMCRRKSI
jgi:hypothetical protein